MANDASKSTRFDLDERLIDFAVSILTVASSLDQDSIGNHLGRQLIRSGTSPALNYAEALGAESRKDFVHKMKIVLKELRETAVCLRLLVRVSRIPTEHSAEKECKELIAIVYKSIQTATRNMGKISNIQ